MRRLANTLCGILSLGVVLLSSGSTTAVRAESRTSIPVQFSTASRGVLEAGDSIRFLDERDRWRSVHFLEASSSGILVASRGFPPETLVLPADVARVQVLRGTKGHTGEGLLVGAFVGFGVGYLAGDQPNEGDSWWLDTGPTTSGLIGMVFFGFVGGLLGNFVRTPTWEDVMLVH